MKADVNPSGPLPRSGARALRWSPGIRARLFGLVAICAAGMGGVGLVAQQSASRLAAHADIIAAQQEMLIDLTNFGDAISGGQVHFATYLRTFAQDALVKTEAELASARQLVGYLKAGALNEDKMRQVGRIDDALARITAAVVAIVPVDQRTGPASLATRMEGLNAHAVKVVALADGFAQRQNEPGAGAAAAQLYRALRVETMARAAADRLQALDMGYAIEDAKAALSATGDGNRTAVAVIGAYEQAFTEWLDVASSVASNAAVTRDVFEILAPIIRETREVSTEMARQLLAEQRAIAARLAWQLWLALGIVLSLTLGLALLVGRSITRPIGRIRHVMVSLSRGDMNATIPHADEDHEIGSMARSVAVFQQAMRERERLNADQLAAALSQTERSASLADAAGTFNRSIAEAQERVRVASDDLSGFSRRLLAVSGNLEVQMKLALEASDGTATRTGSVAAAADELAHSIAEINRQIAESSRAVQGAASAGTIAEERMAALQVSAGDIGAVVSLINDIASRTNLLALNASIEAARAGTAGRGFAVVAEEIKSLAGQTARATGDISVLISGIQTTAGQGAGSVRALSDKLQSIMSSSTTVAAAVAQQDASVGEIAGVASALSADAQQASSASSAASSIAAEAVAMAKGIEDLAADLAEARGRFDAEARRFVDIVQAA